MKVKSSLFMMALGASLGVASCAYLMSSEKTKNKAEKVVNNALDGVNQKRKKCQ